MGCVLFRVGVLGGIFRAILLNWLYLALTLGSYASGYFVSSLWWVLCYDIDGLLSCLQAQKLSLCLLSMSRMRRLIILGSRCRIVVIRWGRSLGLDC